MIKKINIPFVIFLIFFGWVEYDCIKAPETICKTYVQPLSMAFGVLAILAIPFFAGYFSKFVTEKVRHKPKTILELITKRSIFFGIGMLWILGIFFATLASTGDLIPEHPYNKYLPVFAAVITLIHFITGYIARQDEAAPIIVITMFPEKKQDH